MQNLADLRIDAILGLGLDDRTLDPWIQLQTATGQIRMQIRGLILWKVSRALDDLSTDGSDVIDVLCKEEVVSGQGLRAEGYQWSGQFAPTKATRINLVGSWLLEIVCLGLEVETLPSARPVELPGGGP